MSPIPPQGCRGGVRLRADRPMRSAAAYDQAIIRNTREVIQRSRELLQETAHRVLPSSQRGDDGVPEARTEDAPPPS